MYVCMYARIVPNHAVDRTVARRLAVDKAFNTLLNSPFVSGPSGVCAHVMPAFYSTVLLQANGENWSRFRFAVSLNMGNAYGIT